MAGAALSAAAAALSGAAVLAVLVAILVVGAGLTHLYDSYGGGNGVFFFIAHYSGWFSWWTYAWINSTIIRFQMI